MLQLALLTRKNALIFWTWGLAKTLLIILINSSSWREVYRQNILYTKCVCTYFFLADKFENYNFRKNVLSMQLLSLIEKKPDKYAFNVKQFDRIGSRLFCISMLRCVYTSDFLMHFPHCIAIFYYLPWLSKTKINATQCGKCMRKPDV